MSDHAKIIMINPVWARVEGLSDLYLEALQSMMRIRDSKCFGGFKGGRKTKNPGYVEFMSDDGEFLVGLIPEVCRKLDSLEVPNQIYRLKGCTVPYSIDDSLITNRLVMPRGCPLREDQLDVIRSCARDGRGTIHAATGYGKTAVMAALLKLMPKDKTAIVAINSVDLMDQTLESFAELGVDKNILGVFNGTDKRANRITITTVQSLGNLVELLPHVDLLIADEAHREITTPTATPFWRMMEKAANRYAFSATPWKRKDKVHNYKLLGHFGEALAEIKAKELQEQSILSSANAIFHTVNTPADAEYDMDYHAAYDMYVVENDLWHDQVAALIRTLKGRTLIRVERKDHGDRIIKRIPNAIWVSGDDTKKFRREVRHKLQSSPIDTPVVATRIFNTGVDIYIHNLVNCAALPNENDMIQLYGRGLRLAPDKDHCDFHDFMFFTNKFLERHSKERARTLRREGHNLDIVDDLIVV